MLSRKRAAQEEESDARVHSGMSKADLDSFLEQCGATATNPYSVEEIFSAVTGAMWDAVIVPKLEFCVDAEAVSKVRLCLDRARKSSKRQRVIGLQVEKEKDEVAVAAVAAHNKACTEAGITAPFLLDGRAVDSKGKAATPFAWSMLNGKGKSSKKSAQQQQKEDKANANVLRVAKPKSEKGWAFRSDPEWAMANLDKIAQFLGDQEKDAEGALIPCNHSHTKAQMDERGTTVIMEEYIRFEISDARKEQLKTLKRVPGFKNGLADTPIDLDKQCQAGELGKLGTIVSVLKVHLEDARYLKEKGAHEEKLASYSSAADVFRERAAEAQTIRDKYDTQIERLQAKIDATHAACGEAMKQGDMPRVVKLGQEEMEMKKEEEELPTRRDAELEACMAHYKELASLIVKRISKAVTQQADSDLAQGFRHRADGKPDQRTREVQNSSQGRRFGVGAGWAKASMKQVADGLASTANSSTGAGAESGDEDEDEYDEEAEHQRGIEEWAAYARDAPPAAVPPAAPPAAAPTAAAPTAAAPPAAAPTAAAPDAAVPDVPVPDVPVPGAALAAALAAYTQS